MGVKQHGRPTVLDKIAQPLRSSHRDTGAVRLQELRALLDLDVLGKLSKG